VCAFAGAALLLAPSTLAQVAAPDLATAHAFLLSMDYSGEEAIRLELYPRRSSEGTYRDVLIYGWDAFGEAPPTKWANANFPMELSARIDEDERPDRVVLTLEHKEPATIGMPPPYSATVGVALYLAANPAEEPGLRFSLTSRPFHHPDFETRRTPHGVEILLWEDIGTMKGGDYEQVAIWSVRPSGAFERTLDPVTGDRVDIIDIDDDKSHEVVVRSRTMFAQVAMADYWMGQLAYTADMLTWDGVKYSRAPAEHAQPYVRGVSRDLVAAYPVTYAPEFGDRLAKLDLMEAIENCYYWGATEFGDELLDRYETELRTPVAYPGDDFPAGVDRVIATWRSGSALAGHAYSDSGRE